MCSVSLALMGVGTAISAYGQYRGAQARSASASTNAAIADMNAQIGRQAAEDTRERGRHNVQQHKLRVHRFEGEQLAGFASGGAVVDEGSPMDVLENTAYLAAIDEETIRNNAEREAYQQEISAYNSTLRGELFRQEAESEAASAPLLALGTLAGGAGRMFNVAAA